MPFQCTQKNKKKRFAGFSFLCRVTRERFAQIQVNHPLLLLFVWYRLLVLHSATDAIVDSTADDDDDRWCRWWWRRQRSAKVRRKNVRISAANAKCVSLSPSSQTKDDEQQQNEREKNISLGNRNKNCELFLSFFFLCANFCSLA